MRSYFEQLNCSNWVGCSSKGECIFLKTYNTQGEGKNNAQPKMPREKKKEKQGMIVLLAEGFSKSLLMSPHFCCLRRSEVHDKWFYLHIPWQAWIPDLTLKMLKKYIVRGGDAIKRTFFNIKWITNELLTIKRWIMKTI